MKIINMADRLKDNEDRILEAMFSSDPVNDDGFSVKVISRVRRRMWVQRFSLPTAMVIGAIFAAKPLVKFAEFIPKIMDVIPQGIGKLIDLPMGSMPQTSTLVFGAMLLAGILMLSNMLED